MPQHFSSVGRTGLFLLSSSVIDLLQCLASLSCSPNFGQVLLHMASHLTLFLWMVLLHRLSLSIHLSVSFSFSPPRLFVCLCVWFKCSGLFQRRSCYCNSDTPGSCWQSTHLCAVGCYLPSTEGLRGDQQIIAPTATVLSGPHFSWLLLFLLPLVQTQS